MSKVFGKGFNVMKQLGSHLPKHNNQYLQIPQLSGRTVNKIHAGYLQSYFLLDDGQIIYLGAPINKSYTSKVLHYHNKYPKLLEAWQKYTKRILSRQKSLTNYTGEPTLLNGNRIYDQHNILDFDVGDCSLFYNHNSRIYAMGENDEGQLGIGDTKYVGSFEKVRFSQHEPIAKMSAGPNHTIFVSNYGSVFGCGKGLTHPERNSVTDEVVKQSYVEPVLIDDQLGIKLPAAGQNHTILLSKDNKLYGYGSNTVGQSGQNPSISQTLTQPTEILCYFGKYQPILDIKSGLNHTLILTDKRVYFIGSNSHNQYPFKKQASGESIWSPLVVPIQGTPIKVFAKFDRSAILTKEGLLYVFGGKEVEGQLGEVEIVKDEFVGPQSEVGLGYGHTLVSI